MRWLLMITRDMRVHVPPQLFWTRANADFEARRWLWFLFGWTRVSDTRLAAGQVKVGVRHMLHLVEMEIPESWVAEPLWACMATDESTYPKLAVDLIAGDWEEAKAWVLLHSRKAEAPGESFGAEWCFEKTFHRRGTKHYAAAHKLRST